MSRERLVRAIRLAAPFVLGAATIVSALLLVGFSVVWIGSYFRNDALEFGYTWIPFQYRIRVTVMPGRLGFTDDEDQFFDFDPDNGQPRAWTAENFRDRVGVTPSFHWSVIGKLPFPNSGLKPAAPTTLAARLGFRFGYGRDASPSALWHDPNHLSIAPESMGAFVFAAAPLWSFVAVFALLPAGFCLWVWRRKRRTRAGHCAVCDYDLRAHKPGDKCPECGTTATPHTRVSASTRS